MSMRWFEDTVGLTLTYFLFERTVESSGFVTISSPPLFSSYYILDT